MRIFSLFLVLLLSACSKPIAYLNNTPRSSGLEKEGDLNANLNFSPDPKIIQTGITWSPVHRIGLGGDYFFNASKHEQLKYSEAKFLYYIPMKNNTKLEVGIAIGKGRIMDERSSYNALTGVSYDHQVNTNYLTRSVQTNYSPYNDGTWQMHFGLRFRNLIFDKYSYIEFIDGDEKSYTNNSQWNVFLLDPFFELNRKYNSITLNLSINPTYTIYSDSSIPKSHPVYTPSSITMGITYHINKK